MTLAVPAARRHRACLILFALPMRMLIRTLLLGGLAASIAGCASTPPATPRETARNAFADLNRQIEQTITDPARRETLIGYSRELNAMMIAAADEKKALGEKLIALNRDYDATAVDFDALFAAARSGKEARQRRLLAIYREASEQMTPDEWQTINKFKVLTLEAALNLYATPEALP